MDGLKGILWTQIKALKPSFLAKKPHFNFISAHYIWVIGLSILASVLLYATGRGELSYIDALLFGTGANTQAGLNPVDVNLLNTFQQVLLMFCSMTSNPITINSFVVFLRLFWFEKRFQGIAREARHKRRSMSKSQAGPTYPIDDAEKGVNGRNITVITNGTRSRITNDGILLDPVAERTSPTANGRAQDDETDPKTVPSPVENHDARRPEITFADTVTRSDGIVNENANVPARMTHEEHIAILHRQRNPSNDEVLRIPGPRDAERGMRPSRVAEGEAEGEADEPEPMAGGVASRIDTAVTAVDSRQQAIRIEEPSREERDRMDELADDARAFAGVFRPLRLRKPRIFNKKETRLHHEEDAFHVPRHHEPHRRRQTFEQLRTAFSRDKDDITPYLSWQPTLGRNSAFPDLNEEQREELGGIEYRSLKTLALVLTFYFWGFWFLGVICLTPWILRSDQYGPIVDQAGQNRTWWGFWTGSSAFMDLGFTLTPDSMNSFNTAVFPLLLMSFLIVIGNTGFPVMLRFVIWLSSLFVPPGTGLWEELRFLLDHPRRCFTLLFPSGATWWLFWLLVALNIIDLIFFIVLDLGSGPVNDIPIGVRILDGLFQAFSTRTAGFSCVNLADVHPAVQTSYMIMMYISVFPIAISVRRTNVYEEKALGIYGNEDAEEPANGTDLSYVGAHLRRQLSFDLWYIFIGFFILSISEGPRLQRGDFQMFSMLFEIVSAYGTVGLSLGYSGISASLCSQFSVVGKLVIIAMMIRGRHRGLPYGLDRAILLPSESLNAKETANADARAARRNSMSSANAGRGGSVNRGRKRSISRDGASTNIFTQFLHPGPPLTMDPPSSFGPLRKAHTESVFTTPKRSNTDPSADDARDGHSRFPPRRSDTSGKDPRIKRGI